MKKAAKASVTWWVLQNVKSIPQKLQFMEEMKAKLLPEEVPFHRFIGQWHIFSLGSLLPKEKQEGDILRVTSQTPSTGQLMSPHIKPGSYVPVPAEARISMVVSHASQQSPDDWHDGISVISPSVCFGPFHNKRCLSK